MNRCQTTTYSGTLQRGNKITPRHLTILLLLFLIANTSGSKYHITVLEAISMIHNIKITISRLDNKLTEKKSITILAICQKIVLWHHLSRYGCYIIVSSSPNLRNHFNTYANRSLCTFHPVSMFPLLLYYYIPYSCSLILGLIKILLLKSYKIFPEV